VSDAATYRQNADELLQLALRSTDPTERGRMISLAASWHMRAADIERGSAPNREDFSLDLFDIDAVEAGPEGCER
jgi:hypothetical protein